MNGFTLGLIALLPQVNSPDTIVVCPLEFRAALQPWLEHRQAQGHVLRVIAPPETSDALKEAILAAAGGSVPGAIVLVGDPLPQGETLAPAGGLATPTRRVDASVIGRWSREDEIASDNFFADLDGDGAPDAAIGRLPADGPEELAAMVRKTLRFEAEIAAGTWRRRISLVAGVGGFGAVADGAIEMAARTLLTEGIPAEYDVTVTYGNWRSPYCPDPRRFREVAISRLNEGCLFWAYVGHGLPRELAGVEVPGGYFPILDSRDAARLQARSCPPIAILLACYTGAFDQPEDCLAEVMLKCEGGPAAVCSGSRVTMPYGMAVLGDAIMEELFCHQPANLGELILQAKRRMLAADPACPRRQLLDSLALVFNASRESLAEERREHVVLFNLLGDPLLRLPYSSAISLAAAPAATAGQRLRIRVASPVAGHGSLDLVCRRDRSQQPAAMRVAFEPSDRFLRSFDEEYERVHRRAWLSREIQLPLGVSELEIEIPEDAHGPCHIRAFVNSGDAAAMGAADVFIRRPRAEMASAPDDRAGSQPRTR